MSTILLISPRLGAFSLNIYIGVALDPIRVSWCRLWDSVLLWSFKHQWSSDIYSGISIMATLTTKKPFYVSIDRKLRTRHHKGIYTYQVLYSHINLDNTWDKYSACYAYQVVCRHMKSYINMVNHYTWYTYQDLYCHNKLDNT